MSEKKRHKIMIGIEVVLLCMILATLSINAVSGNPPSNGVSYNKNNQTTVQNALDDLYNKANYGNATAGQILKGRTALVGGKKVTGTYEVTTLASQTPGDATAKNIDAGKIAWVNGEKVVGSKYPSLIDVLKTGNYVSYTPSNTAYIVTNEDTGVGYDQAINPSKLNLWKVLRHNINASNNVDGTVDLISVYASMEKIKFEKTNNYAAAMLRIVRQYETSGVTVGSRAIGLNNVDIKLVRMVGLVAPSNDNESGVSYWLYASNPIATGCTHDHCGGLLLIVTSEGFQGSVEIADGCETGGCGGSWQNHVRPIVTLKSTLKITGGDGTKDSPYTIGV